MIHIPILRHGVPYKSLDVIRIPHHRTRETFAEMSQANGGIIRRDLRDETQAEARAALAKIPFEQLLDICARAADHFLNDTLPLGDDAQSPDDYVQQLSATTGMPHALVRRNMGKIAGVMTEMRTVLRGLTRGLDLSMLDAGYGEHAGHALSFYPRTQSLGVVLPSNSPGRPLAVGSGHRAEDSARAQARQRRAVVPVSAGAGVHEGGLPARGVLLLPGRPRRRRRDPAPHRPEHVLR